MERLALMFAVAVVSFSAGLLAARPMVQSAFEHGVRMGALPWEDQSLARGFVR